MQRGGGGRRRQNWAPGGKRPGSNGWWGDGMKNELQFTVRRLS